MTKILISACLLGQPVRYDGSNVPLDSALLQDWRNAGMLVPLCPELSAGFAVPRAPAEIEPGQDGGDVLSGTARIFEDNGSDVTDMFREGAHLAVQTAKKHACEFAILTDGSPSCGSSFIYSGDFDGARRDGMGVVAAALRASGVQVFSQSQIDLLADAVRVSRSTPAFEQNTTTEKG